MKNAQIHIRLDKGMLDGLKRISKKDRRTVSEEARFAIEIYLRKRK